MRRPVLTHVGRENLCLPRPSGTGQRMELRNARKENIRGEMPIQIQVKVTSIFTIGTPHPSAHSRKDAAPVEISTCWETDGNGHPQSSSPSPDSRHSRSTPATPQISLMASTTSLKEAPPAPLLPCCGAHSATGFNHTTNTF